MNLDIYSVSDRYISYLRSDPRLRIVFDNKENGRIHTRKYLGVVFAQDSFLYYVPFSSPKNTDYVIGESGFRKIRKDTLSIIRIISTDTKLGKTELLGTLKLSNMIPVPKSELVPYKINDEKDIHYKNLVMKEYMFIKENESRILKNARVLYNQKSNPQKSFPNRPIPGYIVNTVDFCYAERKCLEFRGDQL